MFQRTVFAAILMAVLVAPTFSQTNFQAGFTFGSNYSTLRSDLFTTAAGRLGMAGGCSFVVGFGNRFELNQEILFAQKGAQAKAAYFQAEQAPALRTYDYFYNTFETAIFAGFQPAKTIPVRFQAGGFLGTHFSNLARQKEDLMIGNYQELNLAMPADDLNDAFSGLDFGPAVGISAGTGQFRANVRAYFGAKNLYQNLDFVEGGHRIRTSALRLSLTYFLK